MNEEFSIRVPLKNPNLLKDNAEKLKFIIGKNQNGDTVVGSIEDMQHILIAGAAGFGKSTLAHGILISLIQSVSPDSLRLILYDSNVLEFGCYRGIPHLLVPPITDSKMTDSALCWVVSEINRRLSLIAQAGCRSFEKYNDKAWEDCTDPLPHIAVILDDISVLLQDIDAKEHIADILLHGRSAGVHLVAITNSVSDKAVAKIVPQFPTRVCFGTQTKADSKMLIDSVDAAEITSIGDFILYSPHNRNRNILSTYRVFDDDIETIKTEAIDRYGCTSNTEFSDAIAKFMSASISDLDSSDEEPEGDEMLPAAVDVILETGQASVSMLQRRLKLGYARAARIIDEMEEKGIVGPFQGSNPRVILITKEQWKSRKNSEPMDFDDLGEFGAPIELPDDDSLLTNNEHELLSASGQAPDNGGKEREIKMYCRNCGKELSVSATVCPFCGIYTQQLSAGQLTSIKKKWPAFWLCLLLGGFGVHRFYVGKIGTGVLWLLTGGVFGFGWLVDTIVILCGSFKDKAGLPLL